MRYSVIIFAAVLTLIAGTAFAQTNFGLMGGALFPFGDFGKTTDISPYVGATLEIQEVNAIGQVAVLSFIVQGGYAFLQTDADREEYLDMMGISGDGHYFDAGVGARVYSTANPLFLGAGVSYLNVKIAGQRNADNGIGGYVSVGFANKVSSFRLSIEGRANIGFVGNDTISHAQALVGFGLPF